MLEGASEGEKCMCCSAIKTNTNLASLATRHLLIEPIRAFHVDNNFLQFWDVLASETGHPLIPFSHTEPVNPGTDFIERVRCLWRDN